IASDKDRKIIIVSAPGKRFDGDIKVTDLLIELASQTLNGSVDTSQTYKEIVERYRDMAEALEIQEPVIDEIKKSLNDILNMDK
ncbi:aspartate kinase, partial [Streptococcus oralis]|nr:aspartate kinase [Streptococcus oralis]